MKVKTVLYLALLFMVVGGIALGQALPLERTGSLIITDTGDDLVFRCTDFNLDGDYNDVDEIILFFDPDPGSLGSNPIKITADTLGNVYVSDTTQDCVFRLKDLNGDGDALDAGESIVYVDPTNAGGILISGFQGMACDTNGDLYLVNSGTSTVPDYVCRCRDLTGDDDCNDAGEMVVLYDSIVAAGLFVPIILAVPMPCVLDSDGYLYVSDVNDPNGNDVIVRMKDLNGDDDMYDTDEVIYFYDDTIGSYALSMVDSMAIMHDGRILMNESLLDIIYIGDDMNGDGDILDLGEIWIYRDGTGTPKPDSSKGTAVSGLNDLYWSVYLAEYTDPDGFHGMRDLNGDDDCNDTDELEQVYDETIGALPVGTPKGLAFLKGPSLKVEGVPQIGGSIDIIVDGCVGNAYRAAYSWTPSAGILIPPYGVLNLGGNRVVIGSGTIGNDGTGTLTRTIPNNSSFVGRTIYLQCIAGDAYLSLFSNAVAVTIQ